jgi:hypothetical protein
MIRLIKASPIDTQNINREWIHTIQLLTTPSHLNGEDVKNLSEEYVTWLYWHRLHTLEYLCKLEWDNKLKLNTPHGFTHSYQSLGILWQSIVRASINLFESSNSKNYFESSAYWFGKIYLERTIEGIDTLNKGKNKIVESLQKENKLLRLMINPFDKEKYPYTSELIDLLIRRSEQSPSYKKAYFKPFLDARYNLVKHIKSSNVLSMRFENGDFFYIIPGTAKSRVKLKADIGLKDYVMKF